MSQSDVTFGSDKLKVVLSICGFISKEIKDCASPEVQESLTVSMQCLEAAYGIDFENLSRSTNFPDLWNALIPVGHQAVTEAEVHKQKGNDLMAMGSFQEAVDSYSRAIELNPQSAILYCNRAAAYSRMENYNSSVADCETAVKLDPNYSKAYGRLGLAYLCMNLHAKAIEAYGTALRLDPSNEMYKQNLEIAMESFHSDSQHGSEQTPNLNAASKTNVGGPVTPQTVQSAVNQLASNPDLLNMASEMLGNPSVRNAMAGLIQMRAQNTSNPSMENLLQMSQQLVQQMQTDHPDVIETLRRQFSDHLTDPQGQPAAHPADKTNQKNESPDP